MPSIDCGESGESVECEIRKLMDDRAKAIAAKDVDACMAVCSSDIVVFDVVNPLQYTSAGTLRGRTEQWFGSFASDIGYQPQDVKITTGGDLAVCHYLYRVSATTTAGAAIDMFVRATDCYSKIDGKWLITHQHQSVPFDPATGHASLDLKPD